MSYKCTKTFESTTGITDIRGRVIPSYDYTELGAQPPTYYEPTDDT